MCNTYSDYFPGYSLIIVTEFLDLLRSTYLNTKVIVDKLPVIELLCISINSLCSVLDGIGISFPILINGVIDLKEYESSEFGRVSTPIKIIWKNIVHETDCYQDVISYLKRFKATEIAEHGSANTPAGVIFSEDAHTLREKVGPGQQVICKVRISGATDIAVLAQPRGLFLLRHEVKFAIVIKPLSKLFPSSKNVRCLSEAIVQLLGFCIGNRKRTPAVILTNLTNVFIVLSLRLDINLKYTISCENFSTFQQSLFVADKYSTKECISRDFCQGLCML